MRVLQVCYHVNKSINITRCVEHIVINGEKYFFFWFIFITAHLFSIKFGLNDNLQWVDLNKGAKKKKKRTKIIETTVSMKRQKSDRSKNSNIYVRQFIEKYGPNRWRLSFLRAGFLRTLVVFNAYSVENHCVFEIGKRSVCVL